MNSVEQAWEWKQALVDFVFEAEGELAESLESYAAAQSRQQKSTPPQGLIVDMFLTEGDVQGQTPLDLFLQSRADWSDSDRHLLQNWHHSFTGLFVLEQVSSDQMQLMNWLTAKHYTVHFGPTPMAEELAKLKPGEILLTRIAPLADTDSEWMLFSAYSRLGKLGKPKLAVAIGNFKDNYPQSLYGDAPDLLEEAWRSVEKYHQVFVDFFGADEVTMSGYELNKQLGEFRDVLAQRFLAEAGVDESKSLEELAAEAGMGEDELAAAAAEAGVDAETLARSLQEGGESSIPKMMAPQVQLPDELKKAEQVTVLAHPRWGQTMLPTYQKFQAFLEAEDWQSMEGGDRLVRKYLEDDAANPFVWHRLAQRYPEQLETVLQTVLDRPDFSLQQDLDALLQEHGKPLEPTLPEIASVPLHLHTLFEEAVQEVQKSKSKNKQKAKKSGFGR